MKVLQSKGYVTVGDYSSYVKFNMFKGKFYRLKVRLLVVAVTAACLLLGIYGVRLHNMGMIIGAGIVLLCSAMFAYVVRVNVRNYCRSRADYVRSEQQVVFGKNGFTFEVLSKNNELPFTETLYSEIEVLYFAPGAIYIYLGGGSVVILPSRNINLRKADAIEFLTRYVPAEKLVICV